MGMKAWKTFQLRIIHGARHARKMNCGDDSFADRGTEGFFFAAPSSIQTPQTGRKSRIVEFRRAIMPQKNPKSDQRRVV